MFLIFRLARSSWISRRLSRARRTGAECQRLVQRAGDHHLDQHVSRGLPGPPTTPPPTTVSAEGANQVVTSGQSCDPAGDCAVGTVTGINVDMTPPSVSVTGVTSGTTYGTAPTPACATSDSLSGVATSATLSVTSSGTSYTATCSGATDKAGNTAAPVSVSYQVIPTGWTTASLTDSSGNPISGAAVVFRSASGSVTNATTGPNGTAGVTLTPGTYSVTMYYATGYQTKTITVTASGPNAVSFATVAVTAQINDPDSADLAAASVAHAGNTGTFGPKTARRRQRAGHLPGAARNEHLHRLGRQRLPDPDRHRHRADDRHLRHRDGDGPDQRPGQHRPGGGVGGARREHRHVRAEDPRRRQRPGHLPGAARNQHLHRLGRQRLPDPDRHRHRAGDRHLRHCGGDGHRLEERQPADHGTVAHAGNTGSFGPKTAVDGNGQVTFQVLPGTNTFTAWDGSAYATETLTVTAATSTSISVS